MGATLAQRGDSVEAAKARAIVALGETGNFRLAALAAGVDERTLRRYRSEDPELEAAAQAALADNLRDTLERGQRMARGRMKYAESVEAEDRDAREARREALDWVSRCAIPIAKSKLPEMQRVVRHVGEVTHRHEVVSSLASDFLAGRRPELGGPVIEADSVEGPGTELDEKG